MAALDKRRRKKLQKRLDEDYGYRQYHDDDVEIRQSKCGSGVFAVRRFLPGELVMEVTGQLIRAKDYEGSDFVMELDGKWCLEPAIPAAYLNHSCSPNTELLQLTRHSLGLLALCNIESGTEITFDYQWPALEWIPKCQCGAPNCRGWVVAKEEVKSMRKLAKRARKPR